MHELPQVRSDKYPLGDRVVSKLSKAQLQLAGRSGEETYVDSKIIEVPDTRSTRCIQGDGIVCNKWVMLADIVCIVIGVRVIEATIAVSRHVLLIFSPADVLLVQKVHNGGYIGWDIFQVVIVQSPEVTSHGADIIGLARVSQAIVASESDTL